MKIIITENQLNLLSEAKASKFKQISYPDMPDKLFNFIVSIDKTSSNIDNDIIGKYGIWLLKLYETSDSSIINYIHQSTDNITDCIKYFDDNIDKFEVKDIFQYKNIKMFLYDVVEEKFKSKSKVTEKDYTVFYQDDTWLIIIPHTKEASIKYGSNTRWCTAAKLNNAFNDYNPIEYGGPLYYNINRKTNQKYSFHSKDGYRNQIDDSIDFIPGLPVKISVKYTTTRLLKGYPPSEQELNIIPDDEKIKYFELIVSNGITLTNNVFDIIPYELKRKYFETIMTSEGGISNYQFQFAPDDLKRKYANNIISKKHHFSDFQFECIPDDLKIKYIEMIMKKNSFVTTKIWDLIPNPNLKQKYVLYLFSNNKLLSDSQYYTLSDDNLKMKYFEQIFNFGTDIFPKSLMDTMLGFRVLFGEDLSDFQYNSLPDNIKIKYNKIKQKTHRN